MTERKDPAAQTPSSRSAGDRKARLAQALRANLRRRKQAGKAGAAGSAESPATSEES